MGRHSMDHIELAASAAFTLQEKQSQKITLPPELYYDLRVRGAQYETDIKESRNRIMNVNNIFDQFLLDDSKHTKHNHDSGADVIAHFTLSADDGENFGLKSSIGRELAFGVHHAIHHLALVKIIALHHIQLKEYDLPPNFGMAPSTIQYLRS